MMNQPATVHNITLTCKRCLLLFTGLLMGVISQAQLMSFRADRDRILIGEHITCTIDWIMPPGNGSMRLHFPDSIPHFNIISRPSDTDTLNGKNRFRRQWVITSYDSGRWFIPAMLVSAGTETDSSLVRTDSILVDVGYDPADSTGILRDIKPVMELPVKDYTWWYVAAGLLLALLATWLLYRYARRRRSSTEGSRQPLLPPFEEATQALAELQHAGPGSGQQQVNWHAGLSFILRRYLSRTNHDNLLSATTDGLLLLLSNKGISRDELASAAAALRTGDAVIYAKFRPAEDESLRCMDTIRAFIEYLNKKGPVQQKMTN